MFGTAYDGSAPVNPVGSNQACLALLHNFFFLKSYIGGKNVLLNNPIPEVRIGLIERLLG